ncbi:PREDICTED: uncharacterized protein LOC107356381 [Acropora digitifera]|uniref:uncharacterized protein LOC107356381 n=1 Tax=Acropora digitifera TaxID=70779 RepID=UPI00077A8D27|nr:PREDICTED: uncharacterized protein LOC107356381 [Acropora digitifera]
MSSFYSRNRGAIWLTLAASGVYFLYRYYEYKRKLRERNERIAAGLELFSRRGVEKLVELRDKLEQLLGSLDNFEPELPDTEDDECVVCNSAKAIIQTYPCKHRVLCRRCFVRTLQVAVNDLNLPLRCVVCRTRIQTLDRERFIGPSLDHQSNGLNQDREHHEASGLTTDTERHEVHGLTSDGGFHEEPGLELNREHQNEHSVDANEIEHLV